MPRRASNASHTGFFVRHFPRPFAAGRRDFPGVRFCTLASAGFTVGCVAQR